MTKQNKPEVLLLGGQKCATSWLYRCLREHPDIFVPSQKRDSLPLGHTYYEENGIHKYFEPFDQAQEGQIIADSAVSYLYTPESPEAIKAHIPDCRFIVMFRDPIERAISAFFWSYRNNTLPFSSVKEALKNDLKHQNPQNNYQLLEKSLYYKYLKNYLTLFDSSRFLFILFDAVNQEPENILKTTYEFCGVDSSFKPESLHTKPKKSAKSQLLNSFESRVKKVVPQQGKFYKAMNYVFYQLNEKWGEMQEQEKKGSEKYLPNDLKEQLRSFFNADTEALIDHLEQLDEAQVLYKKYLDGLKP